LFPGMNWYAIKDGDPRGRAMLNRHYSINPDTIARKPKLFIGPGEKMALMTSDSLALFVWRKYIDDTGQKGVNCAVFRNEGPLLSSMLILEAEQIAWGRWPGERLYTYINVDKIRHKRDPGRCFRKAGWKQCGYTKGGLLILYKVPVA